jgi:hypothetical protein
MTSAAAQKPRPGNTVRLISEILQEVTSAKQAGLKQAAAAKKAGSGRGETSHQVMGADDGTVAVNEGARGKENTADVKSYHGEGAIAGQEDAGTVAGASSGTAPTTAVMDASEVSGNVAEPKATKDKPSENGRGDASDGHPSNTTFNEKYSNAVLAGNMPDLGNSILEYMASLGARASAPAGQAKSAAADPAPAAQPAAKPAEQSLTSAATDEEKRAAAVQYPDAAEAGWMAAESLLNLLMQKQASAAGETDQVTAVVEGIAKAASDDAEEFVRFMYGYVEGQQMALNKRAEGEAGGGGDMGDGGAGGGMASPGGEQQIPPEVLAALAALAAQDTGGGGAGAAGGLGGGGEGGGGEMGGDESGALESLVQTLEEAGVSPQEFAAAVEAVAGGEGGGGEGGGHAEPDGDEGGGGGGGGGDGGGGDEMPPVKSGSLHPTVKRRLVKESADLFVKLRKQADAKQLRKMVQQLVGARK